MVQALELLYALGGKKQGPKKLCEIVEKQSLSFNYRTNFQILHSQASLR